MDIKLKPGLLSSVGLRVLDLDNLEPGDIEKYKIPFYIGGNREKLVSLDQWQLWIKHYMYSDNYFIIDEKRILVRK